MTRDIEPALVTEIEAPVLRPVLLSEFLFDGGDVRFWNGLGDLSALGNIYTGSGNLLSVSEYEETQDLQAQGFTFTLTGMPSSIISIALQEDYQGRETNLFIGALDTDGILVSDPYRILSGFMDVMEITEAGEYCAIDVNAENKAVILNRKKDRRYTPEDQKSEYAGDLGFDFVPLLQDKEVIWKSPA